MDEKSTDPLKGKFSITPNQIIDDRRLRYYSKLVYGSISRHADAHTKISYPSIATIAEDCGIGLTSVKSGIAELVEYGYIAKGKKDARLGYMSVNLYTIIEPENNAEMESTAQVTNSSTVATRLEPQPHHDHGEAIIFSSTATPRLSPQPQYDHEQYSYNNTHKEKKERKESERAEQIPITQYPDDPDSCGDKQPDHTPLPASLSTKKDTIPEWAVDLATLLLTLHRAGDAKYLVGKDDMMIPRWASDIEKIARIDGRDIEEIRAVIRWCKMKGNFWFPNIMSGAKLREKFDTLILQMRQRSGRNPSPVYKADERVYTSTPEAESRVDAFLERFGGDDDLPAADTVYSERRTTHMEV